MAFPFGQLMPDAGELAGNGVFVAENVLPIPGDGYGPMKGLSIPATATALADVPKGIISLTLRNGTWQVFGATSSAWYPLGADFAWGTAVASGLSLAAGDYWSFTHFGAFLLGTNTADGLYAYNVEAGGASSQITAANRPRYIFSCANVLIGLDCLDKDGSRDNRLIRNSAINDHTNWTTKGADYQPLESGGALVCGADVKNNTAVVFQERAISVMQFGNAPGAALYSLYKVNDQIGCVGARSMVPVNSAVYFLATDGFCRYVAGGEVERIGAGRIDKWFLDNVDQANLDDVQGSIDPLNKMVWWRWPNGTANTNGVTNDLIGYSWQFDRWVTSDESTSYLSRIATPGYTLDAMDAFGVLDDITIPLDDRFWQGGQPLFGALDENYKFGVLSGANLAATIQTSTRNNPVSGLMTSATPLTDAATISLELGVKDELSGSITWKTGVAKKPSGRCPIKGRGKNIAFKQTISAGQSWNYTRGIDHIEATGGARR